MKRTMVATAAAVLAGGLSLAAPAPPAGAVTTFSSSGTEAALTTDATQVRFSCVGGKIAANGTTSTPTLACSAVTKVTIAGASTDQVIRADDLNTGFSALVDTYIDAKGGNDVVYGARVPDQITAGAGDDAVVISTLDLEDTGITLGGSANDSLYVWGASGADDMVVSNSALNLFVATEAPGGSVISREFQGVKALNLQGYGGADNLNAALLTEPTSLTYISFDGGDGDDVLKSAPIQANMSGGAGTNTFVGNVAADYVFSSSDTDKISTGGGANRIADIDSLRSGGRTITSGTGTDTYDVSLSHGDAVWRVRPGTGAGTARTVASLNRTGLQQLPASVNNIGAFLDSGSEPTDHTLADIVAVQGKTVFVNGGSLDNVIDITIPTGSWSTSGTIGGGSGTVTPQSGSLGAITLVNVGPVSVHGPWTNKNRGFVHRATRDLLFRFASVATLDEGQAFLGNGTLTRPLVTSSLMDTDEYRGLDVDRTFVKYLRRKADSGGRTYWINSIRNGKALWRFRAQLFGSNEYFTKAGGSNADYVQQAYNDVLGRNPDPSGKTYWTNKLNGGADRGSVALQFINSPEARRRLVDDQFLRFLDRKPTTNEQTTWVDALPGTTGEQDLIAYLVNSGAYYDRT